MNDIVIGERFFWILFFREKLRLVNGGFIYRRKFITWSDIVEVKLVCYEPGFSDIPSAMQPFFYAITIRLPDMQMALDSRRLLYPGDKWTYFLDSILGGGITSAFQQVRFELEANCKDKINDLGIRRNYFEPNSPLVPTITIAICLTVILLIYFNFFSK
ncbi:MAG: hypothetical protein WC522_07740 [Candidatus Omnitrophota bacterium]